MTRLRSCLGWFLALGLAAPAPAADPPATVHGVVFADNNHNGTRDDGEPGLAQVAVSDGTHVVVTDAEGHYELPAPDGTTVFVIKPRGWHAPVNAKNLPQFYRRLPAAAAPDAVDFPLVPQVEADAFRTLVFADTQPASPTEVGYYNRTVVDGLAGNLDFAFGVTLGDLVSDRPDLYASVNDATARIGVPWYAVNGNHDLDLMAGDDRQSFATFESIYGPTTYAFHFGRVLFIALNDVRHLGGPRYIGGLRADQFEFMENLLRLEPRDELVVLMMHIPWFYPNPSNAETFRLADRARLFALLQDRPNVFWLSGHTHYQRHVFYDAADGWHGAQPLHEYNVAAVSGGFWGGPPGASGIPIATMWDGTPHGYAVLSFSGVAPPVIDYRPARAPADHQIGLYAPDTVAPKQTYLSFFANVFNGHDGWKVEARVDDRVWNEVRRVVEWDPAYARLYFAQDALPVPAAGRRLPDPTVCYHLWRGYLPTDLVVGTHVIEVRATDPFGRTYSASRHVRVVEPGKK